MHASAVLFSSALLLHYPYWSLLFMMEPMTLPAPPPDSSPATSAALRPSRIVALDALSTAPAAVTSSRCAVVTHTFWMDASMVRMRAASASAMMDVRSASARAVMVMAFAWPSARITSAACSAAAYGGGRRAGGWEGERIGY